MYKGNEEFDSGMKHMWGEIKWILDQGAGEADTRTATLRAQVNKMINSSKCKRKVLVEPHS